MTNGWLPRDPLEELISALAPLLWIVMPLMILMFIIWNLQ